MAGIRAISGQADEQISLGEKKYETKLQRVQVVHGRSSDASANQACLHMLP